MSAFNKEISKRVYVMFLNNTVFNLDNIIHRGSDHTI